MYRLHVEAVKVHIQLQLVKVLIFFIRELNRIRF